MDNVRWLDRDKGIVHWDTAADKSIEDTYQSFDAYLELVKTVEGPIFLIVDFTAVSTPRSDLVPHFPALGRRLSIIKDRVPFVCIVSENLFTKSLAKIFVTVTEDELHYFVTVEGAVAFIDKYRESHPPVP